MDIRQLAGRGFALVQSGAILGTSNVVTHHTAAAVAGDDAAGWILKAVTAVLIGFAQWIKMFPWFNQCVWLWPCLLVLGSGLAFLVWTDFAKAILNGATAACQAVFDYKGLNASGVPILAPGTDATTTIHQAVRPHPEPAPVIPQEPPGWPPPEAAEIPIPPAHIGESPPALPLAPTPSAEPPLDLRERIIATADRFRGLPYVWGGNFPSDGGMDCSGYVLRVLDEVGLGFGHDTTAEGIRQLCVAVGWGEVQMGDLLFFRSLPGDPYQPTERAGADGFVASHIGISHGAGTGKMHDANEKNGIGVTNIMTDYWQARIFEARRVPQLSESSGPLPAPTATGLVHAIDVASYQPTDLSDLIHRMGAKHVVVKLYQTVERIGDRVVAADHSRAQIASARDNGCTVGGYIWGYSERDPATSVREGVNLANSAGVGLKVLWLDIEEYLDGSLPGPAWIREAVAECRRLGLGIAINGREYHGAVYSGEHVWRKLSGLVLPDTMLWSANYNNRADLDVPRYGGMTLVGHQYTSSPCDRNVFLPEVTA